MKQIIVLLLIIGGGYYLYNNGLSDVLRKANLDPKDFVEGVKEATGGTVGGISKAAELPEIAPERASGLKMNAANMRLVETTVFNTYDTDVCFAYTEMIYASGSASAPKVINKYLATFTLPEDKNKILPLVTKYKDKQSLKILEDFLKRGVFSRSMLLKKISEYRNKEALAVIKSVADTPSSPVRDEAQNIYSEMITQSWYTGVQSAASQIGTGDKQLATHRIAALMNNPNQSNKGDL